MFLTPQELSDLTGLKRPTAQYLWLRDNGWPVELDARKRPKVLRAVLEARMGAIPLAKQPAPNWDALRGPA